MVDEAGNQKHAGRLVQKARTPAIPERQYRLSVKARGEGKIGLGAFGFPDRYSPLRQTVSSHSFQLKPEWQTYHIQFTMPDENMYLSVFLQTEGWLGHADIRNPLLDEILREAKIEVTAGDFIFSRNEPPLLHVISEHTPVKLVLYGPAGVPPGPGGEYGGSDAWIDHFIQSYAVTVIPRQPTTVTLKIPPEAREGFYRVVAVDPATGQSAETAFSLLSEVATSEIQTLAAKISLPKDARIVFVGDSLTDLFRGRNYVDLVRRAISSRGGNAIQVFNAGVGGNNIKQIAARLSHDVLQLKPTHVFLFEGANDCKRTHTPTHGLSTKWAVPKESYETTYLQVLETLRTSGCQVIVMTMAPGDQRIIDPIRERAKIFGLTKNFFCIPEDTAQTVAIQKRLAEKLHLPVIDTNARLQELLDKGKGPPFLHVDDGVHLSEYGNLEVATAVLQYLSTAR